MHAIGLTVVGMIDSRWDDYWPDEDTGIGKALDLRRFGRTRE